MFQPRRAPTVRAVALVCIVVTFLSVQPVFARNPSPGEVSPEAPSGEAPGDDQGIPAGEGPAGDGQEGLAGEARDERAFRFQPSPAGQADDVPGQGNGTRAFGIGDLLRMVLVLLLVVGAVYGVIAFLRRRAPRVGSDDDSPLKILASRDLGANTRLYAVMVGREVLLLGGGEGSLQLISRVEDQETIDELVLAASRESAAAQGGGSFGALLGRIAGNAIVPGTPAPGGVPRSFLGAQQERLRKMRR